MAGLRDAAAFDRIARRTLGRRQAEITHQFSWPGKAREIADLRHDRHRRDQIDAAHRLQGCDNRQKVPVHDDVADGVFEPFDAIAFLAHAEQHFLERQALLALVEFLIGEPVEMRAPTGFLAGKCRPSRSRNDDTRCRLTIKSR